MRPVAAVRDGASGRALELWGNQPCVQLYTANWLNHTEGKGVGMQVGTQWCFWVS
jgi:aldose 1-epimerase